MKKILYFVLIFLCAMSLCTVKVTNVQAAKNFEESTEQLRTDDETDYNKTVPTTISEKILWYVDKTKDVAFNLIKNGTKKAAEIIVELVPEPVKEAGKETIQNAINVYKAVEEINNKQPEVEEPITPAVGSNKPTPSTDNDNYGTVNTGKPSWLDTSSDKVSCGGVITMHKSIPRTTSFIIIIIEIIAPALLAIMGVIDFYKAIMSGKDDMIQKNQKAFVARIISAIVLFVVIVLAKIFVSLISNVIGTGNGTSITKCVDCFISNRCN